MTLHLDNKVLPPVCTMDTILGPVVQSIVSLMNPLRVKMLTVLVFKYNI